MNKFQKFQALRAHGYISAKSSWKGEQKARKHVVELIGAGLMEELKVPGSTAFFRTKKGTEVMKAFKCEDCPLLKTDDCPYSQFEGEPASSCYKWGRQPRKVKT